MVLFEKLQDLPSWIPIDASKTLSRETHRYDSFGNVSKVQIEILSLKSLPILRHHLMNDRFFR